MLDIGKIAVLAVAVTICCVVVRKQVPEIAVLLSLAGVCAILAYALDLVSSIKVILERLMDAAQLSPTVAAPVIKTVGISVLTRFGAEVCRDAKESGLAAAVEFAGAAAALCLAIPLLQLVLDMISELL